jgi:prepilin-type N-terminal cleavage/methylation domain-containing protein
VKIFFQTRLGFSIRRIESLKDSIRKRSLSTPLKGLSGQKGFSLIELMIVIAIIGVLAAIAIPQFDAYRKRSFDSAAKADARNLATAVEAYYVDLNTYVTSLASLTGSSYAFMQSANVVVGVTGGSENYTITAFHSAGDKTYSLSGPGGTLEEM